MRARACVYIVVVVLDHCIGPSQDLVGSSNAYSVCHNRVPSKQQHLKLQHNSTQVGRRWQAYWNVEQQHNRAYS